MWWNLTGHEDGITTVRNAPSPAATSSLAIAEHVVARMDVGEIRP